VLGQTKFFGAQAGWLALNINGGDKQVYSHADKDHSPLMVCY